MARIVCIGCVKSKRSRRSKAADLYTSALFRKSYAYAQTLNPDQVFILSAKHGVLRPTDEIEPYEMTLKKMSRQERRAWSEKVLSELSKSADLQNDEFVFLAGQPYREHLVNRIRNYTVPMEGLTFGQQLQWLSERLPR